MSLEWARAFAGALEVPLSEVLERAGIASSEDAKSVTPEFAEGDVVPWAPRENDRRRAPMVAQALGERAGTDIWTVRTGAMALQGYLPGDYMLVDAEQSERVKNGDVVVAQIYDNAKNRAVTVLRRLESPVLVAASTEPTDRRVHVVDGINVVVRGKVIASWRVNEDLRQPSNHERRDLDKNMRKTEASSFARPTSRDLDVGVRISGETRKTE